MLKNLLKLFKNIFPFDDFLYVLQLEEYDNLRFLKRLPRFFVRRNIQKRDNLKYTSRIQTTLMLSVGIYLITFIFALFTPWIILISTIIIPIYIALANNLLTPFYEFMKYRLQKRATKIIAKYPNLKIIAIAGSYGKTTTKNFIYELVRFNYKTQMIPGNINTPTGIAAWITREFDETTEVLLVEMDAYFIGEIKRSCMITPPHISIITSIGDQHIERFGSQKKMATAIREVSEFSKQNAPLIIAKADYEKLKKLSLKAPRELLFPNSSIQKIKTNIKSETAYHDLLLALKVSELLQIPKTIIKDTVTQLVQPDRRQKPMKIHGFDAIDDSYNISFTTACAGVTEAKRLAQLQKKKLLVITAGIPEVGLNEKEVNKKYGDFLLENADNVLMLNSIFAKDINYKHTFDIASDFNEAWRIVENKYSTEKYFLLVQPELTDLYY